MATVAPVRDDQRARPAYEILRTRGPALVVWGLWTGMLGSVLAHVARYGRNVPLAEDWLMLRPLSGREPDFWAWVWAQNNEHRLPLPRVLYLGLLEVVPDFRVGMVFNTLVVGALAAAAILVARHVRGGRTSFADALFPLAMLHIGHWFNLLWGWQIQFVVSVAAIFVILFVLVAAPLPVGPRAALAIGIPAALLALTGASGLPFVPAAVAAMLVLAVAVGPLGRAGAAAGRVRLVLAGAAALSALAAGLYFVGYERPSWVPDNPGVWPTLETAGRFTAMGFGSSQSLASALAAILFVGSGLVVLGRRVMRGPADAERRRAAALLAFMGGCVLLALSVGYGRAALVPDVGMPSRYAILAVPAIAAASFAWERYGPARLRPWVQGAIVAAFLVALPFNVRDGWAARDWYVAGMTAVEHDVDAGVPRDELVRRHQRFLLHWDANRLAEGIDILHERGIGPFARMRERGPAAQP
jgi:hypothetical protein